MPEKLNDKKIFSLLEVTQSIQKTLSERYTSAFWVKAEMNKLNFYRQSGHCYPELVEKRDGRIIAQIKSHLWREDYTRVNDHFKEVLKEPLKDGIKILFLAKVLFDPSHGLALWIIDIDPSYTLGDLEREKQETIKQLKEEGIFDRNKTLKLPLLPQRIAIISVESSKGYADFLEVLSTNPWRYSFFHLLFPSLLQGDQAVRSIITQMERIRKVKSHFDVVAIIRGGGGDVGLSCYNNYQLAKEIALFPIPVITGIGHATNETVTEMISFSNAITPTKLAEYLLQKFHNLSVPVREAETKIIDRSRRLIDKEKTQFNSEIKLFRSIIENALITNKNEVGNVSGSLERRTGQLFNKAREDINRSAINAYKDAGARVNRSHLILGQMDDKLKSQSYHRFKSALVELNHMEKSIRNMSPQNILKRGYSITLLNGKAIKAVAAFQPGDIIETQLAEGTITSKIETINIQAENEK